MEQKQLIRVASQVEPRIRRPTIQMDCFVILAQLRFNRQGVGLNKNVRSKKWSDDMTKIVIYANSNLDSFYEQTLQYLHDKYHTYPTTLNYGPMTEAEAARISYYDGMGRDKAQHAIRNHHRSAKFSSNDDSNFHDVPVDLPTGRMVF